MRRGGLFFVLFAAAAVCAWAVVFPPERFHFAGSDASNYEGRSLALASRFEGAHRFYPPEIAEADYPLLDRAFTDMRGGPVVGLMTSYVAVSKDHGIEFPHYPLYSWLLAGLRLARLDDAAEHLNYALFFASALLV